MAQPGVWSVVIWTAILALVVYAVLAIAGEGSAFLRIFHPGMSATSNVLSPKSVVSIMAVYVVMLVCGPFWIAGVYGVMGDAIRGEQVGFRTFWTTGRKLYGRGWGFILYSALYGFVAIILAVLFIVMLKAVGSFILIALVILSLPWLVRMAGALFVDRQRWGSSFRASFRGGNFWVILGGLLLALLVYIIFYVVMVLLEKVSTPLAIIVYVLFELSLSVLAPLWMFCLYDVTRIEKP